MKSVQDHRAAKGISQRRFAKLAGLSFRSVQFIESGKHDPKISTLQKIASTIGYPPRFVHRHLESLFQQPPDSVAVVSERIAEEGEKSWKIWLFNFADAFRNKKDWRYVEVPPYEKTSPRIKALLASTVENLCDELSLSVPGWCEGIPPLNAPWFVAGIENLKAMALIESPVHFRKRNIFVLGNFLERV